MAKKTYTHSAYWYAYHCGWTYSEARTYAGKYLDLHTYRPRIRERPDGRWDGKNWFKWRNAEKRFDSTFNPLLLCACAMVDVGVAMREQMKRFIRLHLQPAASMCMRNGGRRRRDARTDEEIHRPGGARPDETRTRQGSARSPAPLLLRARDQAPEAARRGTAQDRPAHDDGAHANPGRPSGRLERPQGLARGDDPPRRSSRRPRLPCRQPPEVRRGRERRGAQHRHPRLARGMPPGAVAEIQDAHAVQGDGDAS